MTDRTGETDTTLTAARDSLSGPSYRAGRHFLQIPGPTNVPARVLAAIAQATIDHRGPDFSVLFKEITPALRRVFGTDHEVVVYAASGTGAWEAALVNTLSSGDAVVAFDNGYFAGLWADMAVRLGLQVERVAGDWRKGPDPARLFDLLAADTGHRVRAVTVVHNETSTGVTGDIPAIRAAIDAANHPALLIVDTISSLGSIEYRHDEWGVDVTIAGSQKGLMLPPGLSFNAIGPRAVEAAKQATLIRSYWDWDAIREANQVSRFPYTPATNLLYGLKEALALLEAESLEAVYRRHARHAEATRRAVQAWDLELYAVDVSERSNSLTAVLVPDECSADELRETILRCFDMSLGAGLGPLRGRVFRIGHLGDLNDLTLAGVLCGIEMGLRRAGVPHRENGVTEALRYLENVHALGGE
jgi:alanine-glyoxylate transaminase/serine-glyoxylate transaminase/serine-pyruvate transaminase